MPSDDESIPPSSDVRARMMVAVRRLKASVALLDESTMSCPDDAIKLATLAQLARLNDDLDGVLVEWRGDLDPPKPG